MWDHFTNKNNKEPLKMWFNANCWGSPAIIGNKWGWWIAEYDHNKYDQALPIKTQEKIKEITSNKT
jgi:hypothetical protein